VFSAQNETKAEMSKGRQIAADALDTLHGARELPPQEAATILKDFFNSINSPDPDRARAAAVQALENLIRKLERDGSASDDDWQSAIERMLSLANETK
jgi:hypothetical protein